MVKGMGSRPLCSPKCFEEKVSYWKEMMPLLLTIIKQKDRKKVVLLYVWVWGREWGRERERESERKRVRLIDGLMRRINLSCLFGGITYKFVMWVWLCVKKAGMVERYSMKEKVIRSIVVIFPKLKKIPKISIPVFYLKI